MTNLTESFVEDAALSDAEIVNVPFLVVLGGCSARRVECRVAGHTNATQRCNAPASAVQKWDIGSFRIPKYLHLKDRVIGVAPKPIPDRIAQSALHGLEKHSAG